MNTFSTRRLLPSAFAALAVVACAPAYAGVAEPNDEPLNGVGMYLPPTDDKDKPFDAWEEGRPDFNEPLRQNEDWSDFDSSSVDSQGIYAFTDPLKRILLNDDGSVWLSVGGSARARYEDFTNFEFDPNFDDGFLLTRALLHGDLHIEDNARIFVQGKTAFSTHRDLGGGQRTKDTDELALQQAFADFMLDTGDGNSVTLRGGRQMLSFGSERLVSPNAFTNSMRTFDGVSLLFDYCCGWNTQAFWTQSVPVQKYDFNTSDRQTQFFGAYSSGPVCDEFGVNADAYFLGLDQSDTNNTFNGTSGAERRYTVGGRLFGEVPNTGLDFDVESAYQFGDLGDADISAWFFASEVGYDVSCFDCDFRAFGGFDYASGDRSSGGDVQTFNPLFPQYHYFNGPVDTIGRQNILSTNVGFSFNPIDRLTVLVAGYMYWLANNDDALYDSHGNVLVSGGATNNRFVGSELDLLFRYQIDPNTTASFGYSRFCTGDVIDNGTPGRSEDIDRLIFELEWIY